jgi:hypothetical protein
MSKIIPFNKKINWYFTWNSFQENSGKFTIIYGTREAARKKMKKCWGDHWFSQYSSAEAAEVEKKRLVEIITPGGKKEIVNAGNKWSVAEDRKLMAGIEKRISRMAIVLNRSEKAIINRLRILYEDPELLEGKRLHSYEE